MTDLPAPLTPPDCDLRDFAFMPLEIRRLLTSETWVLGTAEEKVAALSLWCEAWHQVPAASVPDNERMLAHLSGAGPAWRKVRDHVMRTWVKCSDGRIYHPVVAEKALESWAKKEAQRARSRKANAARWGADDPSAVPQASRKDRKRIPQGLPEQSLNDPKGQGEGQRQGEKKERVPFASLTAPAEPSRAPPPEPDHPLWPVCRDRIGMHPAEFRSWFRDAELDTSNGHPVLTLPTRFAADHVRGQWGPALARELGDGIEIAVAQSEAGPPGIRETLWTEGLSRLRRLTGKPDKAARTLLGQFCRDAGDDCALVSGLLFDAERDRPGDPVAWLSAAIQRRGASGNGHAGRQRDGTLAWIFDDATTGGTT